MPANYIQHYLKHRHIIHSGCTGTCTPHQLHTHTPSAADAPHIRSPHTPCSTSPCSNTHIAHQHHTHSSSAPHTHIHLHTFNNLVYSIKIRFLSQYSVNPELYIFHQYLLHILLIRTKHQVFTSVLYLLQPLL